MNQSLAPFDEFATESNSPSFKSLPTVRPSGPIRTRPYSRTLFSGGANPKLLT